MEPEPEYTAEISEDEYGEFANMIVNGQTKSELFGGMWGLLVETQGTTINGFLRKLSVSEVTSLKGTLATIAQLVYEHGSQQYVHGLMNLDMAGLTTWAVILDDGYEEEVKSKYIRVGSNGELVFHNHRVPFVKETNSAWGELQKDCVAVYARDKWASVHRVLGDKFSGEEEN